MIYDQYELEFNSAYTGSYVNDIFVPPTNNTYGNITLTNTFQIINGKTVFNYNTLFKALTGSLSHGLTDRNPYYTQTHVPGNILVIKGYNLSGTLSGPPVTNFNNSFVSNSNMLTWGDCYNFLDKNFSPSPKRFLKLFCPEETFFDSVMPDPEEIYVLGVVDPVRTAPVIFKKPGIHFISSSYMMLGYNVVPSSLAYVDFYGIFPPTPITSVNPLSDQIYLGNYKWPLQFPFEKQYKNIARNIIKPHEIKHLTSSLMLFDSLQSGIVFGTDFFYDPGLSVNIRDFLKIELPPSNFKKTGIGGTVGFPLGISYLGTNEKDTKDIDSYGIDPSRTHFTKSLTSVVDIKFRGDTIDYTYNDFIPPDTKTLLFHFFGFGDYLGKFVNGLETAIMPSGSSPSILVKEWSNGCRVKHWNYPGYGHLIADSVANEYFDPYQYELVTGSLLGYNCRGYKYGVYKPIPESTNIIFRRNKFGQPRDMLEQRLFTNFYSFDTNTNQGSIVDINFSTTSSYGITASNPLLNPKDSGIYDLQYKCGQPFFDDDLRII